MDTLRSTAAPRERARQLHGVVGSIPFCVTSAAASSTRRRATAANAAVGSGSRNQLQSGPKSSASSWSSPSRCFPTRSGTSTLAIADTITLNVRMIWCPGSSA